MPPASDPLERACDRLWIEIGALLPVQRRLRARGATLTDFERRELGVLTTRLAELRATTLRYREVLRAEAWSRYRATLRGTRRT